jgi:tRNA nucleotidyltransferase (CCA-adding enzyme)
MDLMDVASIKNILEGKRLQKELNAAPGPWMKDALDVCMAWQLRNPSLAETDLERARTEAIEEVRSKMEELKIPVKRS